MAGGTGDAGARGGARLVACDQGERRSRSPVLEICTAAGIRWIDVGTGEIYEQAPTPGMPRSSGHCVWCSRSRWRCRRRTWWSRPRLFHPCGFCSDVPAPGIQSWPLLSHAPSVSHARSRPAGSSSKRANRSWPMTRCRLVPALLLNQRLDYPMRNDLLCRVAHNAPACRRPLLVAAIISVLQLARNRTQAKKVCPPWASLRWTAGRALT